MKNEEIIRYTRYLAKKYKDDTVLTFETNLYMAFTDIANHIEEQAEENDKLKAEIEQLKESRNYISEVNGSLVRINDKQDREITKLKDAIERLKERFEIKDNNFELYSNALEEIEQLKSELEQYVKLPCKAGDIVYREIVQHDSYDDSEYKVISACNFRLDMLDKIGVSIFLTREEAEQSLKGKVEE